MINKTILVGRLTKDVELKHTQTGIATVRFTIAVSRTFNNQNGEKETDFIGCIAWRKTAENMANFLHKGSLIAVEGRIQTGSFDGQDGKRVFTTDVVADNVQFLEPRANQQEQQGAQSQQQPSNDHYSQQQGQQSYQQPQQQQQQQQQQHAGAGGRGQHQQYGQNLNPIEVSDDDLPF